jgi:hypothetical protein
MRVAYQRRGDVRAHLIAHSLGGPPRVQANYVSMDRQINSHGGAWGQMERYIRNRAKRAGARVRMAALPSYPGISKRPNQIRVLAAFNRAPRQQTWNIATP